jgi:tetratricopeptide (TPR) repeat protein
MGAEVSFVNLLNRLPGKHSLPLSVALRDDVIIVGMREQLFDEVLALMDGSSDKTPLSKDPRYKDAFGRLPPAEDLISFFDMQAMLKPLRTTANLLIDKAVGPGDVIINSAMPAEVNGRIEKASSAYANGDVAQALSLTQDAYDIAPKNSIILYNLACYNAALGKSGAALAWLDRAVESGFYAPTKIAGDADFASLKGEPEFEAALEKARALSLEHTAKDLCINFAGEGEVMRLRMQVNQTYETKDYERGLELIKQAYALDPKDSKVVYTMACLHALLGHEEESLKFLDQAVDAGFYCPGHMSRDADLESVRQLPRFKAAKEKAKKMAGEMAVTKTADTVAMVHRIVDRLMNAVGIIDYTATVETTDGYTTTAQTLVMLAPDAKERPIYGMFGDRPLMDDFERYLPAETLSFSITGGVDLGGLYTFIEDTVRLAGQPGEEALAKWNAIQAQLGFDVRRDLTDWIQGDTISVTLEDGAGSVTLVKVYDEKAAKEKIGAAIEFTTTKLREIISQKRELAGLAMLSFRTSPVKHEELEGFQNIYFSMVPEPGVWGTKDGYLIFGTSADAIALVLATARGEHPNIRTNERAMREMLVPEGSFAAVSLTDMRGLGTEIEQGMGMVSMMTSMMGAMIPEPELRPVLTKISSMLGKLAPVVRKVDFYKSSSMITTTDDGLTWHTKSVTNYFSPEERATKDM